MKNLRLVVGAVLALSASSAFAQYAPLTPSFGQSDLYAIVLNQNTGASEVVDLGVLPSSLTNGQTFTVDPALVGLGTTAKPVVFEVFGGDYSSAPGNNGPWVLQATGVGAATSFQASSGQVGLGVLDTYLGNQITNNTFTQSPSVNGNLWTLNSAAAATNWTGGVGLGVGTFNASAQPGTSLNLYNYAVTTSNNGTALSTSSLLGTFSLSGTTLTFNTVSSVPVPAALWLLASGILGLGATRRRRVTA